MADDNRFFVSVWLIKGTLSAATRGTAFFLTSISQNAMSCFPRSALSRVGTLAQRWQLSARAELQSRGGGQALFNLVKRADEDPAPNNWRDSRCPFRARPRLHADGSSSRTVDP